MTATNPALSVVVPTIGRLALLRGCLESLAACEPGPAEVVVVDQSQGPDVERMVAEFSSLGARAVRSEARSVATAHNDGLTAAVNEFVAVTHDDCTVRPDWIAAAGGLLEQGRDAIYTGRVLAPEGAGHVPSTIDRPDAIDYTGRTECRVLYPNNMAFSREAVIALDGFDPRLVGAAEDNDLCYRWTSAGHPLRYDPAMVVWHHDWRSHEELKRMYFSYGDGQGAFYAKHLRRGDLRILRFLAEDLGWAARATLAAALKRDGTDAMPTWMMLKGLPHGLRAGWREFAVREHPS